MGCFKLDILENLEPKLTAISKNSTFKKVRIVDFLTTKKGVEDYYPFGMLIPNRNGGENYRYSFQGQEKDDEIKGEGNSVNYKYRMHDTRLGRFFAVDPLAPDYPHNSPYAFSENMVIHAIELEGRESFFVADLKELKSGELILKTPKPKVADPKPKTPKEESWGNYLRRKASGTDFIQNALRKLATNFDVPDIKLEPDNGTDIEKNAEEYDIGGIGNGPSVNTNGGGDNNGKSNKVHPKSGEINQHSTTGNTSYTKRDKNGVQDSVFVQAGDEGQVYKWKSKKSGDSKKMSTKDSTKIANY